MNQYVNDFTSTVRTYYDELKKYKPLSRARERRLLKLCKRGDEKAKNELLEANDLQHVNLSNIHVLLIINLNTVVDMSETNVKLLN